MGQVNSNLEQNGKSNRNDILQKQLDVDHKIDDSDASVNGYDGMKVNNLNCVRNRIDMLIEDCLNIKESTLDKKVPNVVPNNRKDENISSNEVIDDKDKDSGETNNGRTNNAKIEKKELDQSSENVKKDNYLDDKSDKVKQVSGQNENVVDKSSSRSLVKDNKNETTPDSLEKLREEKLNLTKKKTITTFQKFIDEVFDNSLHDMDTHDVKIPRNFLKLCTDSLVVKDEQKRTPITEESIPKEAVKTIEQNKLENKILGSKKVTLKDHIERFLEASFEEEMCDNKDTVVSKAKNLNAHMLVNDMISRGLGAGTVSTQSLRNEAKKAIVSDTHNKGLSKSTNLTSVNQRVVIIDGDSDKEEAPGPSFQEKQRQQRINSNNSNQSANAHCAKGQFNDNHQIRGHLNGNDNILRTYKSQDRHDPFDPRFADPRFHDNRIDIVTHEVNAHSKRDLQFERRHIPKTLTNVDALALTSHGQYQPKAHYSQGPSHMNMRHSPSVSRNDYQGLIGNTNAVTGHHVGCKCPACVSHTQQNGPRDFFYENKQQQHSLNYPKQNPIDPSRISPLGNPKLFYNDQSLVPNRQPHSTALQLGQPGYPQLSPKLVPQRSPIPAPPVEQQFRRSPSSADNLNNRYLNIHQRQTGFQEFHSESPRMSIKRNEQMHVSNYSEMNSRSVEEIPNFQAKEGLVFRSTKMHLRDSAKRRSEYENRFIRGQEKLENESAPLDLTVKRSLNDQGHNLVCSHQFGQPSHHTTKLSPTLTFIKHLENSVDKYCQELNSPPSPIPVGRHGRPMENRSLSPNGKVSPMVRYSPLPSPHGTSPQGLYPPMLQGRSLPSPHYSGGITMGQPLVDKSQKAFQQISPDGYSINSEPNIPSLSAQQGQHQIMVHAQSGPLPQGQINFDSTGKRITCNVSRHEPVPNLIGNHDSNDILYMYCKVCNSTYGSLYGFRKHFRNQHGFEPRAEHTIVHTISGTKSALHIPAALPIEAEHQNNRPIQSVIWNSRMDERRASNVSDRSIHHFSETQPSQVSPQSSFSSSRSIQGNGEMSLKQNYDNVPLVKDQKETKFLECPECGKTFQLNDFGSYKRHCRQHGHIKPFGCTDCQLSFNDQKGLKEHYKTHMKESQMIDDNKSDILRSAESDRFSDKRISNSAQFDTHNESVFVKKAPLIPEADNNVIDHIKDRDQLNAQTKRNIKNDTVPNMTQKICSSPSIVKQAAESMTALACPDSSWDKKDDTTEQVVRTSSEISVENCDSGYSSSVGSNLSQLVSDDNSSFSGKKADEKDGESVLVKPDFNRTESSEDSYDLFYKHKKFFHKRKRGNSITSSPGDCSSNKYVKVETPPLSCVDVPVSTSTKLSIVDSSDSTEQTEKDMDVTQGDINGEKLDKSEIKTPEPGDLTQKMKSEARHNLPFVWDRATRSRKTK